MGLWTAPDSIPASDTLEVPSGCRVVNSDRWERLNDSLQQLTGPRDYPFVHDNPHLRGDSCSEIGGEDQQAEDAAGLFESGLELYRLGRLVESRLALEAVVQKHCDNDEAWRTLGLIHAECDDDSNAMLCFKTCVSIDPYNTAALASLAACQVNESASVQALQTLCAWLKHSPQFMDMEVLPDAYSDGTLLDSSTQLLLRALSRDPDCEDVNVLLSILFNLSDESHQAIPLLRRALVANPHSYSTLNKVCVCQSHVLLMNMKSNCSFSWGLPLPMRPISKRPSQNMTKLWC